MYTHAHTLTLTHTHTYTHTHTHTHLTIYIYLFIIDCVIAYVIVAQSPLAYDLGRFSNVPYCLPGELDCLL